MKVNDRVFESGKTICVELTVKNTGKMSTPVQPIRMSLQDNKRVSFDSSTVFALPAGIMPGQDVCCSENLLESTINKPVATQ